MSKQFKVGDVCIVQQAKVQRHLNGEEVVVVRGLGENPPHNGRPAYMGYVVEDRTGKLWSAYPHQLRLKRPPRRDIDEVVSWESVGWMPMDVKLDRAIKESLWDQVREKA